MPSTAYHTPPVLQIRYFLEPHDSHDSVEVTQAKFEEVSNGYNHMSLPEIEYERHTMRENGVSQVVLTLRCYHEEQFDPESEAMQPAPGETQPRPKYETKSGEPT